MLNKQRSIIQTIKQPFNKALATAALLLALNGGDPSFAQTAQNNSNNKPTTTVTITTNDAISFAVKNVSTYYPDMKEHLTGMINQFGKNTERKNAVDSIFNQTIMKISDPKQRIGATIYALEGYVFRESDFGDKYDSDITNETFLVMENAKIQYETRLKQRQTDIAKIKQEVKDIQARIDKNKAEIEKNKVETEKNKTEIEKNKAEIEIQNQEMRNILNKITIQDMKDNEQIKKLVIQAKVLFIKYGTKTNSKHIDELFKLIP